MSKTPKLRFTEFSGEWEENTIGNIFDFYTTNSYSRDCLNDYTGNVKNIHYGDIHMNFPTILDVKNNNIPYINDDISLDKISKDCYCKEGDIVIADASEDYADIGKTIEVKNIGNEKIVAGLHTLLGRDNKGITIKGYRGYMLLNNNVRKQIKVLAVGSKVLGISKTNVNKVLIYIPKKEEQQKIANFFSLVDKKIEKQQEKVEAFKDYKKGMMQKLFSQEIRFKGDNGEEYPEWKERKLSELLFEHKIRNYDLKFGKQDVLSVSGEYGIVNQIEFLGRSYAGESVDNYHVVHKGDIVYTKSPLKLNPYGIIKANKDKEGIVSTLYAVYSCKETAYAEYLDYYFQLDDNTNRYVRPLVNKGAKNDMKINNQYFLTDTITVPEVKEQQKIATLLSTLDKKLKKEQEKLDSLNQWKKGLLQQMFV